MSPWALLKDAITFMLVPLPFESVIRRIWLYRKPERSREANAKTHGVAG